MTLKPVTQTVPQIITVPNQKETIITADKHVTNYEARIPNDATEDQTKKVINKLKDKLATKNGINPNKMTMNTNTGVVVG